MIRAIIFDCLGVLIGDGLQPRINQELIDYIEQLRPKYKIGLLSNISKPGLERRFSQEFLNEHFDSVVISGDTGLAKPDPAIYIAAMDELGVEPDETLFIDDNPDYVAAAAALGIKSVQFLHNQQLFTDIEVDYLE